MTTTPATSTETLLVIVQDQSQFSHVVIDGFTGPNALANAKMCIEETIDYGQEIVRPANGSDMGQVDINGQLVEGILVTNEDSDELTLVAIIREF